MNRLGHACRGLLGHLFRIQVFNRDQAILGNNPMRQFVLKILALVCGFRVKAGYMALCLLATLGAAFLLAQLTLSALKPSFSHPVPAGIVDLLSRRESGETRESHVDADFFCGERETAGRDFIAREDGVPVCRLSLDRNRLDLSFGRAVKFDPDLSDLGEPETFRSDNMESFVLRPRQAVIPITSFEARMAGRLTEFYAPEEVFERKIDSMKRLLKNLSIDLGVFGAIFLDERKLSRLIFEMDRDTMLPCLSALLDGGIVELSASVKPFDENTLLSFGGVNSILEGASESSYNRVSHDALCLIQGRSGQKPRTVSAVVGFDYYEAGLVSNQEERNTIHLPPKGDNLLRFIL